MSFLAPYFLIGLGALIVPVIIHMWSKDAKQSVAFGSLRFLKETETRTTRSIMPSQWLLLLTRLLLLTLLVFLLAEMQLPTDSEKSARMYLVDPSYQDSELVANLLDTIAEGVDLRWLTEGYPSIDQKDVTPSANYWNLLANLPAAGTECLVVISPLRQQNFMGKRESIPTVCQWIKLPIEPRKQELAEVEKNGESYSLSVSFDEWATTIAFTESASGTPIEVSYYLEADEEYNEQAEILEAALASVQEVSNITLKEDAAIDQVDWVLWISQAERPNDARIISADSVLNWTSIGNDTYLMPSGLTMEDAIQMELPRQLLDAFMADYFMEETNDLLTVDTQVFDYAAIEDGSLDATADAASLLWMTLLALLLLERWLSYKSTRVAI